MLKIMKVFKIITVVFTLAVMTATCGNNTSGGNANKDNNSDNETKPDDNVTLVIPTIPKKEFLDAVKELEVKGIVPVLDRTDSILGEDKNADGVRDDIETYILSLPDTDAQKAALRQTAKSFTAMLLAAESKDENALENASKLSSNAINCSFSRYGSDGANKRGKEIEKYMVNTIVRAKVYSQYNRLRGGSTSTLPQGDTCDE